MDTWAINHRKIYFRDVTDQCRNVTAYDRCPAAELFIVPDLPGSDAKTKVGDLAAFVVHNLKDVNFSPVSTAGDSIAPGIGVRESRMVIRAPATQAEFCWYLDTTFCYAFHRSPGVINTLRTLFVIFYIISIAMIVYIIGSAVVAVVAPSTEDDDPNAPLECGSRKCTNLIDYLSVMPTVSLCVAVRCPPVKTRTPPHLLAIRSRHSDGSISRAVLPLDLLPHFLLPYLCALLASICYIPLPHRRCLAPLMGLSHAISPACIPHERPTCTCACNVPRCHVLDAQT